MSKYFYIIVGMLLTASVSAKDTPVTSEYLKQVLIGDNSEVVKTTDKNGKTLPEGDFLDRIFTFIRDGIFELLLVFALFVFLYIAFKLIIAKGNPEEFKKALQSFIYAAVGLFIIAFAWAIVRLVAGLSI